MNILYLNHNPENYGTYFRCFHLAKAMARRGHALTLLCASNTPTLKTVTKTDGNLTILVLPRINLAQYHTGHTLRMLLNARHCLTRECDILHAFAFPLHPIAFPTLITHFLRPRVKIVLDHDDMWKGGFTRFHPGPVRRLYDATEDYLPRLADRATAASDILMNKFREAAMPEDKIHYIPNCPTTTGPRPDKDEARRRLGLPAAAKCVISMGHTYTEALFLLLEAYERAKTRVPSLKLLFLGKMHISRDFKNRMKPYLDRHGPDIVLAGEKPPAEVPHYLAAMDALLLPMDDDPIEKARFPIRFGDYLASGVPVVSNAVGEIKRIMETYDCGYTARVDDAADFGDQIVAALTDTQGRGRKHDNAVRLVETVLNWDAVAAELERIYAKTLEEPRKRG